MATQTYTGDLGAAESRISSLTSAVSQGYSGLPGVTDALRKSLYEREKTLPALEVENESKIKELYTADKRYADTYANPTDPMYIEDPMKRQSLVSGQKADIRGELGGILNLIQQRSQTLGNAVDKGLELYKSGLEAQKLELEMAEKQYSRIFEKLKFDTEQKGKGTGTANTATDQAAYAEAMRYLTTQVGNRKEALEDIGIMAAKNPRIANDLYKLADELFPAAKAEEWQYKEEVDPVTKKVTPYKFNPVTGERMLIGGTTPPAATTNTEPNFWELLPKLFGAKEAGAATPPPTAGPAPTTAAAPTSEQATPTVISQAQANIDKYTDPSERQQVYQQIIADHPYLAGKIFP